MGCVPNSVKERVCESESVRRINVHVEINDGSTDLCSILSTLWYDKRKDSGWCNISTGVCYVNRKWDICSNIKLLSLLVYDYQHSINNNKHIIKLQHIIKSIQPAPQSSYINQIHGRGQRFSKIAKTPHQECSKTFNPILKSWARSVYRSSKTTQVNTKT